jgi:hypothetical protein
MSYRVLSTREAKWQPRKGLEGPFWFVDRVLYYDPKAGKYWDPTTDFYLEQDEVDLLQQRVMDILSHGR